MKDRPQYYSASESDFFESLKKIFGEEVNIQDWMNKNLFSLEVLPLKMDVQINGFQSEGLNFDLSINKDEKNGITYIEFHLPHKLTVTFIYSDESFEVNPVTRAETGVLSQYIFSYGTIKFHDAGLHETLMPSPEDGF